MAGEKINNRSSKSLLRRLLQVIKRALLWLIAAWLLMIIIWRFLPVPFSAVMVERQFSAWFSGNTDYIAHSDWVPMSDISPYMALAVIASEDQKFPEHWGFDVDAISSVLDNSQDSDKRIRGASTISQQTAKNVFLWDGRSWLRKGLETGLTVGIETLWSKQRILTVYLNVIELGDGVFGVEQASQHFFHKPANKLTASEAALLAAVLPNPKRFKVGAPSRYILMRQQWILRQMQQLGGTGFLRQHDLID